MKAHIGVDAESGLVHTVSTTAANVADIAETATLLHGKEQTHHRKVRYTGLEKNTAQVVMLFGLANLVLAKNKLLIPHTKNP